MTIEGQIAEAGGLTMPSIRAADIDVHDVPLIKATAESFADYGRLERSFEDATVDIVTWPQPGWRPIDDGTGTGGGIAQGAFEFWWSGAIYRARNLAVDGDYVIGWFGDPATASTETRDVNRSHIFVCEANYHPDSSQTFFPRNRDEFVALLAPPGDDVTPDDFVAFYCDGSFGITIKPGVWHQPVFPLRNNAIFDNKQGRVHACISCAFVAEFRCYLSVPLRTA
ncbi:MAG: ureidoglycolate lyase [Alphaproteobacteria bacterium]|nr:ureidoglycolate lyase [Alphaproteobacteria bacterium]